MRWNRSARPDCFTLFSWWNRSPLVISTISCSAAMASTASRMPGSSSTGCCSSSLPSATMRCRSAGADAGLGDLDRGLHHRQRHALHAVAEQREVAHLHRVQALVRARVVQVDVVLHDALELGLCTVVVVLAAPEGVVAVEADQANVVIGRCHARSMPARKAGVASARALVHNERRPEAAFRDQVWSKRTAGHRPVAGDPARASRSGAGKRRRLGR